MGCGLLMSDGDGKYMPGERVIRDRIARILEREFDPLGPPTQFAAIADVLAHELGLRQVWTPISSDLGCARWEGDFYTDRKQAEKATWDDGGVVGIAWITNWVTEENA